MGRMDVCTARLTICILVALVAVSVTVLGQDKKRKPPNITEPESPSHIFKTAATKIVLSCQAEGDPDPEYEWYVNKGSGFVWINSSLEDDGMSYDPEVGKLTIDSLDFEYEGNYTCRAFNYFVNQAGRTITPVSVSPNISVQVSYLEDYTPDVSSKIADVMIEHRYYRLECDQKRPNHSSDTVLVWVREVSGDLINVQTDNRVFIDQNGTLHFANAKEGDATDQEPYACGLSNSKVGKMVSGVKLTIPRFIPTGNMPLAPKLEFSSADLGPEALTFINGTKAKLECFFSGNPTPNVTWKDNANNTIYSGGRFEAANQVLIIHNVTETDETEFTCSVGSLSMDLHVDVTSPPIWVERLSSTTVPEGRNAVFRCKTRSMINEPSPNKPKWYRNMKDLPTDDGSNKYVLSDGDTKLTVMNVTRDEDIACYQCFVANHVGETFGDGCLNVLKPITITSKPDSPLYISEGDMVNLTVLATSDPLYPLTYEWIFEDQTYTHNDAPPYVDYDRLTRLASINTSGFSDGLMSNISGVYTIRVFHPYEAVEVVVDVQLQSDVGPAAAGFPFWIIGLIIGLLILLLLILICCCVICRRKMQEGDYPVDKKETAAGLDPEKEVKEGGFPDLSRAQDPNQNQKASHLDLDDLSDGDDESFGGTEYGEEATAFNEDGSFINAYRGKQRNAVDNPAFVPALHPRIKSDFNPNESAV